MDLSLQTLSCRARFSVTEILHKHLFTRIHVPFLCLLKHHPVSPDVFIRNYESIKSLKSVSLSCVILLPPCQRPLKQNHNGKITLSCIGWKREEGEVMGRKKPMERRSKPPGSSQASVNPQFLWCKWPTEIIPMGSEGRKEDKKEMEEGDKTAHSLSRLTSFSS